MVKNLVFLIVHYLLFIGLTTVVGNFTKKDTNLQDILIALAMLTVTLAMVYVADKKSHLKIGRDGISKGLKGLSAGIVLWLSVILIALVLGQGFISLDSIRDFNLTDIAAQVVSLLILCISEEIVFRGHVFSSLKNKRSITQSVFISSALYAFWIFNIMSYPTIGILNKFLFGCILATLAYKNNGIEYSIGFSFLFKLFAIGFFETKGFDILSGGRNGIFSSLIVTGALVVYFLYMKRKYLLRLRLRGANIAIASVVIVVLGSYIITDIAIWKVSERSFDLTKVKSIGYYEKVNDYELDLEIDTKEKAIYGVQNISYINNSEDNLNEICFHNYPAAFKQYGGDSIIHKINTDGSEAEFKIEGEDNSIIRIPLKAELKPGERVNISMEYTVTIPKIREDGFGDRFGYGENTINLGNFFPIAAVYEDEKWDMHAYDPKGDAFYSETSNFEVDIKVSDDYELAVTGDVTNIKQEDNYKIWSVKANAVRDFAIVASDKFEIVQGNINGTLIKVYTFDKYKGQKVLDISAEAIKVFNNRFGEYPYGSCSIVQSDLSGGMEYPGLVMIDASTYDSIGLMSLYSSTVYGDMIGQLEEIVVHEIAHQWWYGLVGNDEFNEAWVDEPMTQFSTLLYYKDRYGEERFNKIYNAQFSNGKVSLTRGQYDKSLDEFSDSEYGTVIYYEVPVLIKNQYDSLGDEEFTKIFKNTFEKYKFKILKGEDFPINLENQ